MLVDPLLIVVRPLLLFVEVDPLQKLVYGFKVFNALLLEFSFLPSKFFIILIGHIVDQGGRLAVK